MKHTRSVAVALVGLTLIAALSARPIFGADEVHKQIDAANTEFGRLFAAGDAAGLAGRYTEDAQLLPPNMEVVKGRAAIEGYWKSALAIPGAKLTLTALEVEAYEDTAIETGRAEIADGQGRRMDTAKYIVIWKRVNGEWKMHKDIFNSDLPAH